MTVETRHAQLVNVRQLRSLSDSNTDRDSHSDTNADSSVIGRWKP